MQKHYQFTAVVLFVLMGLLMQAACQPGEQPPDALAANSSITYRREGGIAGISQEWTIYPDGRIIAPGDQEMQAPPEEAAELFVASAAIEPSTVPETYIRDNACCDQFIYTIIITGGEEEMRINTSDGADHPTTITTLLDEIGRLIAIAEPLE